MGTTWRTGATIPTFTKTCLAFNCPFQFLAFINLGSFGVDIPGGPMNKNHTRCVWIVANQSKACCFWRNFGKGKWRACSLTVTSIFSWNFTVVGKSRRSNLHTQRLYIKNQLLAFALVWLICYKKLMKKIEIYTLSTNQNENPKRYTVTITEDSSKTNHQVTLSDEYYQRLTGGLRSREDFLKASFEFLLEREGKEEILANFDISQIQKYFPEYESVILSFD